MNKLIQLKCAPRTSIGVTSNIEVGNMEQPAYRFTQRFGTHWRLCKGNSNIYFLRDKEDKVQFTLRIMDTGEGDVAAYPDVTWSEFADAWENNKEFLYNNVIYFRTTGKENQFLMDMLKILTELKVDF